MSATCTDATKSPGAVPLDSAGTTARDDMVWTVPCAGIVCTKRGWQAVGPVAWSRRSRAMCYCLAFCLVLLMGAAGCASRPASPARETVPPTPPVPRPETFPVQHTAGPVLVSADPAVAPERLQAVFGTAFHTPSLLPLELVIQNQGTQRLQFSQAAMTLELPDGSRFSPLPAAIVAGLAMASPPALSTHDWSRPQGTGGRPSVESLDCAVPSPKATCSRGGTIESTRADVAAFWTGVGLLIATLTERTTPSAHPTAVRYQRQLFQEGVCAPGEAAHGFVFFASPAERGFRQATLLLRFRAVEVPSDVVVRLPLLGLGGSAS